MDLPKNREDLENFESPLSKMADVNTSKKDIKYFDLPAFRNFKCRGVLIDEKSNGEYHIKTLKSDLKPSYLCALISGTVENASLVLTDPDGTLKLEYPICMKIESILSNEIIEDSLREVDKILG